MEKVELFGRDDPTNEYRIFSLDPKVRCKLCAFRGEALVGSNFKCIMLNDVTNAFATCNKFRPDKPQRKEDGADPIDVPWPYRDPRR